MVAAIETEKGLSIGHAGAHSRGGLSEQPAHPRLGDSKERGDAPQFEAAVSIVQQMSNLRKLS
jgi:hypothetical protein